MDVAAIGGGRRAEGRGTTIARGDFRAGGATFGGRAIAIFSDDMEDVADGAGSTIAVLLLSATDSVEVTRESEAEPDIGTDGSGSTEAIDVCLGTALSL